MGQQWPAPKPLSTDCPSPNSPKPELAEQRRDVERDAVREELKPCKEEDQDEVQLLQLKSPGWTVTLPNLRVLQESAPWEENPVVDDEELYMMQVLDEMDEEQQQEMQEMQDMEDLELPEHLYQELRSYRLWERLKMEAGMA